MITRNLGIALSGILAVTGDASAQQVYKCVSASGQTVYQSGPCDATQTTAKSWNAVPEPPRAYRPPSRPAPVSVEQANSPTGQGAAIRKPVSRNAACETAKRNRDRTLDQVGQRRTYALIQQLNEAVSRACK